MMFQVGIYYKGMAGPCHFSLRNSWRGMNKSGLQGVVFAKLVMTR